MAVRSSACFSLTFEILATALIIFILSVTWITWFTHISFIIANFINTASPLALLRPSIILTILNITIASFLAFSITKYVIQCKYTGDGRKYQSIDFSPISRFTSFRSRTSCCTSQNQYNQIYAERDELDDDDDDDDDEVPQTPIMELIPIVHSLRKTPQNLNLNSNANANANWAYNITTLPFLPLGDQCDDPESPFNRLMTVSAWDNLEMTLSTCLLRSNPIPLSAFRHHQINPHDSVNTIANEVSWTETIQRKLRHNRELTNLINAQAFLDGITSTPLHSAPSGQPVHHHDRSHEAQTRKTQIFVLPIDPILISELRQTLLSSPSQPPQQPTQHPQKTTQHLPPLSHCLSQPLYRLCHQSCRQIKPMRTHHCSVCMKCHPVYDHYCVFFNTCIFFHNRQSFFLFLQYATLGISWLLLRFAVFKQEESGDLKLQSTTLLGKVALFCQNNILGPTIPLLIILLLLLIPLLVFYVYLWLVKNRTTIEHLKIYNISLTPTTPLTPPTPPTRQKNDRDDLNGAKPADQTVEIGAQHDADQTTPPAPPSNVFLATDPFNYGFWANFSHFFGHTIWTDPLLRLIHQFSPSYQQDVQIHPFRALANGGNGRNTTRELHDHIVAPNHANHTFIAPNHVTPQTTTSEPPLIPANSQNQNNSELPELYLVFSPQWNSKLFATVEEQFGGYFTPLCPSKHLLLQLFRLVLLTRDDFVLDDDT